MLGFVWALVYHMMNGVRHLVWDMGYGFELKTAQFSGWLVLIASAAATAGIAVTMLVMRGTL
jgi:succinate dehydrogenase / fumarate reductase cytochrome b subunit